MGDSIRTGYAGGDGEVAIPDLWFPWSQRRIREEFLVTRREIGPTDAALLRVLCRQKYRREVWELAIQRLQAGVGIPATWRFFRRALALDAWTVLPPLFYFAKSRAARTYWKVRA